MVKDNGFISHFGLDIHLNMYHFKDKFGTERETYNSAPT